MNDMSTVILAKSDQWNADDFGSGPKTFTVARVDIKDGQEQPVTMHLEDSKKVFRPCKTVSRLIVAAWGPDSKAYVGRSFTLYKDPKVTWAGMEVGGIRVSHMSHIDRELVVATQEKKGAKSAHRIKPLVVQQAAQQPSAEQGRARAEQWAAEHLAKVDAATTPEALDKVTRDGNNGFKRLETEYPELHAKIEAAYLDRVAFLSREGRPDDAFGDQHDDTDAFGLRPIGAA